MAEEGTFQSFGQELQKARLAKGRSLDQVAAQTKIHHRHLEAIEAGDLSRLPQGPYVKAFVREYARAVGLVVPEVFAIPNAGPARSLKDPKVVSRPASSGRASKDSSSQDDYGLPAVARETARKANTAVRSAVKSVSKTTGSVVNLVETGGKEALEVLTSKSLWDEAEDVRRERLGLPPLEKPIEAKPEHAAHRQGKAAKRLESARYTRPAADEPTHSYDRGSASSDEPSDSSPTRRFPLPAFLASSKRTTNLVIGLLALLFAGAIYFAIRMSHSQSSPSAATDYIPAPVDRPLPVPAPKAAKTTPPGAVAVPLASTAALGDSLSFQLRAIQPVWVSISPDGIPAYRGEMKAGDFHSFRAKGKIVINIGNQKSVEMQFNGQRLSNLPTVPNSHLVIRDLELMRDRVTLAGATLDLKKITTPPEHSQKSVAVIPHPVATPVTPPAKINAVNGIHSAAVRSPKIIPKLPPQHSGSVKATTPPPHPVLPKPAKKQLKPTKKVAPPPAEIHTVEPIPPRL